MHMFLYKIYENIHLINVNKCENNIDKFMEFACSVSMII